ncbi:MAG: sensor histidine kinase, partial [Candidatus Dormibacteraceae bacterium]
MKRIVQRIRLFFSPVSNGGRTAADREDVKLLEQIDLKNDFLQLTIHELRRPLGLINGYLPMLLEGDYGPVPEQMRSGLRMIKAGAAEMKLLIEGLVEIIYLEDHVDALRRKPIRIGQLIKEVVATTEAELLIKKIEIEQRLPEPDILVTVDRHLLRLALINLVGNAIKYCPDQSKVRITVKANPELMIAVSDQGPGIEASETDRIFERWQRGATATSSGLGLGLYLVRKIVDLHGGRITLKSTPNKGST